MLVNIIKLIVLGSFTGFLNGFFLNYTKNLKKPMLFILYNLKNILLIILLFYVLHLSKISFIIFVISFILTFWTYIIKY